ncbi:MAG: hypothetical protein MUC42_01200 [Bryobacter sp.]|nr:hypothetical protein [Bryobacter sp.]
MRVWVVWLTVLGLAGCARESRPRPLLPQNKAYQPVRFDRIGHYVSMNQPGAERYFVRDVAPYLESNLYRWTGRRPELRFAVPRVPGLHLVASFTVAEATFGQTGPVAIQFQVNGHEVHEERCEQPGNRTIRIPIAPDLLPPTGESIVVAEIDKVWRGRAGDEDKELGFILIEMGFSQ